MGVRVVRQVGRIPASPDDGELIYYGRESSWSDTGLTYGQTYGYAVYAFDREGRLAYPATCLITIDGTDLHQPSAFDFAPTHPTKCLIDGHLFIQWGDELYTIQGMKCQ